MQNFIDVASVYSDLFLYKGVMINKIKSQAEMLKHEGKLMKIEKTIGHKNENTPCIFYMKNSR